MESLVKRLKDELRASQQDNTEARSHLKESGEVIMSLQSQVTSLKHKLVMTEGASKSQFNQDFTSQLKEIADLRQ